METTTIQINRDLKEELDSLKIHSRETFNELLSRIISGNAPTVATRESLIATIEVLSDPEMMKGIGQALQEDGGTPLEKFEKELGL